LRTVSAAVFLIVFPAKIHMSPENIQTPAADPLVSNRRFTAMMLAVCALLLAPTLAYRMGVDHGSFAYIGAEILEGRWPYLHTWESDYPGLMFLQALEIFLFGKSIAMFRLFDLIFQLGNCYFIYRIAARVGNRYAAFFAAAVFCLIYQGYGPWNTAQREGFGLLFILMGFWLYLTAERRPAFVTAAGIGLGFGLGAMFKPTLLALAAFYAPLLRNLNGKTWTRIPAALAGFLVPIVAIIIFYWSQGGLVELYEACFSYETVYAQRLRGDDALWVHWLAKLRKLGIQAAVLSILYVPFLLWGPARRERCMLYLGYLGSIFAVWVQGTFAGYHYIPGLAIGAIFLGTMLSQTIPILLRNQSFELGRIRIAPQLLAAHVAILAALPIYMKREPIKNLLTLRLLQAPLPNEFRNEPVFDFTEDFEVAQYLKAHTQPEDRIQVWGYESLVYYLADRDAASRFQISHPLVLRIPGQGLGAMQLRWRQEFLQDMAQRQPVYIAVVREDRWWWAPEERTSEELLDDFPGWKEFIHNGYVLEHTIGRFLIYRRSSVTRPVDTLQDMMAPREAAVGPDAEIVETLKN
jgi:hypothetical protein